MSPQTISVIKSFFNRRHGACTTEAITFGIVEDVVKGHRVTGNLHVDVLHRASRSLVYLHPRFDNENLRLSRSQLAIDSVG